MPDITRTLTITADGSPVTGFNHARLTGADSIGLEPMPFTMRLWNLSNSDYYMLSAAKRISVLHGDSVLAAGNISDVCRHSVLEGRITEVVFSAGLSLWEAPVSLSVETGVSVSETVRRILSASGTGIPLLSFPGADPIRTRGQAFFGRAAECIAEALSAAGARGYLTDAGLCVIPASGLPVSMALTVLQFTLPMLGFLVLDRIVRDPEAAAALSQKKVRIAASIPACFCLLCMVFPGIAGTFSGSVDAGQPDVLVDALITDRRQLLVSDAIRSLMFILAAFGLLKWGVSVPKSAAETSTAAVRRRRCPISGCVRKVSAALRTAFWSRGV